jgi:hypothetical protein
MFQLESGYQLSTPRKAAAPTGREINIAPFELAAVPTRKASSNIGSKSLK